tara:strand:- start:214 stop:348 length:135 start_codon:yes stop_codon:yes gene_type:complete
MILTLEQLLAMTSEELEQALNNQDPDTKAGLENTHKIIDLLSSK